MTLERVDRQRARELIDAVENIAARVAAPNAADVDDKARFPHETLQALKDRRVLSAAVPVELGGAGCGLPELAAMCSRLARACGSSAMILAMHHIEVACLARHGAASRFFREYLQQLVEHQYLIASVTSEVGTFGETRTSRCALEKRAEGGFTLSKEATTISYGEYADALLVTCRRGIHSPPGDQVLVLLRKGEYSLERTSRWNTMGMRGTCSPGFKLSARVPQEHIVPGSFADSSPQTMVPYSHVLWASLWWGIAADAVARATAVVRAQPRGVAQDPPLSGVRLAEVTALLQTMRDAWSVVGAEYDGLSRDDSGMHQLLSMEWAIRLNNLKVTASESAAAIVHRALQIAGIRGYANDSPHSVARHYRDVLSASLMISNERIASKTATMLLA